MNAAGVISRALQLVCMVGLLSIAAAAEPPVPVAPPAGPAQAAALPATPAAIPSVEVIAKASEVASHLSTLAEKFAPSDEIRKIEQALPESPSTSIWISPTPPSPWASSRP